MLFKVTILFKCNKIAQYMIVDDHRNGNGIANIEKLHGLN
jgi:hypothetical protein